MGLCLERGTAKTTPAPEILQLLSAPMETAGVRYHCTQRHHSCKCVRLGLIPKDAECKGSQQPPWVLLWLSSFSEKVNRGVNSLCVVFFPVVQASQTAAWEGKCVFQRGGGNGQREPRQLSGTHLPPAPNPPPECQCWESGSLAL